MARFTILYAHLSKIKEWQLGHGKIEVPLGKLTEDLRLQPIF